MINAQLVSLPGPSHNFSGLSAGNVASMASKSQTAHPKLAALESIRSWRSLLELGVKVIILPPHPRPIQSMLLEEAPDWATPIAFSSAFMWTANLGTVIPSIDSNDGRLHICIANLSATAHRQFEATVNYALCQSIFGDSNLIAIHSPLPPTFRDEGAANHMRFHASEEAPGLHVHIFGESLRDRAPRKGVYPYRQIQESAELWQHRLSYSALHMRQTREAVDAGCFHNDVLAVSEGNILIHHESAWGDDDLESLKSTYFEKTGSELFVYSVSSKELSLEDSVSSYFFNMQLISRADGGVTMLLPFACKDDSGIQTLCRNIMFLSERIDDVRYQAVGESLKNGGGPACLRLRVPMTSSEFGSVNLSCVATKTRLDELESLVDCYYPDTCSPGDFRSETFISQIVTCTERVYKLLQLPVPLL